MTEQDIKQRAHEFIIERWAEFKDYCRAAGDDPEEMEGDEFDLLLDEALLDTK